MRFSIVVGVLATAHTAVAGPNAYAWLPSAEVLEAEHSEANLWIYERDDRGGLHERASVLGSAPAFGATDALELRFPFELVARSAVEEPPQFGFARFGGEACYRFTRRGSPITPVGRIALLRDVEIRSLIRVELGGAIAFEQGVVHVEAAADVVAEVNRSSVHSELHPGLGASVRVSDAWRFGGELYAEVSLDDFAETWIAIAPNAAARFGRSWLSAALGLGLHGIALAPRIQWGLAW